MTAGKPKGGRRPGAGNPAHAPTPQTRRLVEGMILVGKFRQEHIARVIGIDMKTLRKYYREQLDMAYAKDAADLRYTAKLKAVGGPPDPETGELNWREADGPMLRFLLASQYGVSPMQRMQHSGAVGSFDLTKLTDEELSNLEAIRTKLDGASAGAAPFDDGDLGGESEEGGGEGEGEI